MLPEEGGGGGEEKARGSQEREGNVQPIGVREKKTRVGKCKGASHRANTDERQ